VRIADEDVALESLLDSIGKFEAIKRGLVNVVYKVDKEKLKEYVEGTLRKTGELLPGTTYEANDREELKVINTGGKD
jgi:hypothetical protein